MNKKWKESEKQFVRTNCSQMKDKEIAEKLTVLAGRVVSIHAVRKLRQGLGIKKLRGRGVCQIVGERERWEEHKKRVREEIRETQKTPEDPSNE